MTISATHRLENGDRISRDDFERLCAEQQIRQAELIDGVVRMNAAAVRFHQHGKPHALMMVWLGTYAARHPGTELADNTSVRLDAASEPQPDILMFRTDSQKCRVADDGFLEGTPDLVVEIAASSVSYDAHEKRRLYERCGVPEYILWRTEDRAIDWFVLSNGRYEILVPEEDSDSDQLLRSRNFPGLILDRPAMVTGNIPTVLSRLHSS